MADPTRISLNTATLQQWSLRECVEGCARYGISAIGPWRNKVHELGLDTATHIIDDHGLQVSALCRGGMFTSLDDAGQRQAFDENRAAIDEAAALGAACLVLVVGGIPEGSKNIAAARAQVVDGIGELLDYARSARVPLAIEPLHPMYAADRACINTLSQANDVCDQLGEGVGVAIDVYHVWWDPELEKEIARARNRILGFHVSDWLLATQDLLLDRGMMGDGVVDIPQIRNWVEKAGYKGPIEVEIFSAQNWWKRDGNEVLETILSRFANYV